MTKEDVSALSNAIVTIGNFIQVVSEATSEDSPGGKNVNWIEGVKIAMKAVPFISVFKSAREMWDELQDLDEAERQALMDKFAKEFDIKNDEVEATIEEIFDWVIQGMQVVSNWKTSKI